MGGGIFQNGALLLIGGILFTIQIYCDFSGYSDIAIGCAKLFGINLMQNFNFPYFSRSLPEFWRKWHISLTTWFRDYIYIPLGGSRCNRLKVFRNVYIVWMISGLWHGANWTFICWGVYHGSLLVIYNLLGAKGKYDNMVAYNRYLPNVKELGQIFTTIFLVILGWIIFRVESINDIFICCSSLFEKSYWNNSINTIRDFFQLGWILKTLPAIIAMIILEWVHRDRMHAFQIKGTCFLSRKVSYRYAIYIIMIMIIVSSFKSESQFIYFQF